jgi:hypothetical protein
MKIRVLRVAAALCRDRGPDKAGASSIFIRDGELEKIMWHFHENAVVGGGSRSVATLIARSMSLCCDDGDRILEIFP